MSFLDRWRRRVTAPTPPPSQAERYAALLEAEREAKDAHFRHGAYSPIPHGEREQFGGLAYFAPDLAYRMELPLEHQEVQTVTMQDTAGQARHYERIGVVRVRVGDEEGEVALYQGEEGELFVPFRDGTSGDETYGAGRYLEPIWLGDDQVLLDFNLAYNPYCAYSDSYACPLPPRENWLALPIRAGERYPHQGATPLTASVSG